MYKFPGSGIGPTSGGVATLAVTGTDIGWWAVLGGALIVLGAFAFIASYRRNQRLRRSRG